MARSRNIKPGFFANEELVELPFSTRLLFIGLWTIADREGRLEDKPKRIKMVLFPADNLDVEEALTTLADKKFLQRYEVEGIQYIQILAFKKHQNPHKDEKASTIPAPCLHHADTMQASNEHSPNPADSFNPITDSFNPIKPLREKSAFDDGFEEFWNIYPKKVGKDKALPAWKKKKPPINDVLKALSWQRVSEQWIKNFIPNPTTYINEGRWKDEPPQEIVF